MRIVFRFEEETMTNEEILLRMAELKGATLRVCQPDPDGFTHDEIESWGDDPMWPETAEDMRKRAETKEDPFRFMWPCIQVEVPRDDGTINKTWRPVHNWPENITHAMRLTEGMNGYAFKKLSPTDEVIAVLYPVRNMLKGQVGKADTLARAICLAWIKCAELGLIVEK
jgi:hypothetical protein